MQTNNKIDPFTLLKWGGTAAAFYLGYKFLKSTGLIPSNATNLNDQIESKSYTLPNFWRSPAPEGKQVIILTANSVNKMIEDLWNSTGLFNDCESCMSGVLKSLHYKTQYSYLADKFFEQKGRDLTAFLKSYFNADELLPIWSYLDALPTYKSL